MSFDSASTSSSDHSSSSSLFSRDSVDTFLTSRPPSPTYGRPAAPLRNAALKATIRLPLALPPAPTIVAEFDLNDLIVDSELKYVPIGYVLAKMRSMGENLLDISASVAMSIFLHISSDPNLPSYLP